MTAGTVVITGGILATVILLCIIAVLCYCRLQYYCCKRNESEGDTGSGSQPQFACNACSAPGVDGAAVTPLSLSPDPAPPRSYCPTCSPYSSPFYIRTTDEMRNGGERITYMPTHYENPSLSLTLSSMHGAPLSTRNPPDFYTNTRAISTEV
ncbi:protein FAM163A [Megalops cyprinoides]|uniref:protein FAM163A n=1 Tax=Megalops cyprinoides TaxID=118141 RepID=UPI001863F54B|nr:protein FAM163A [Megalops cyprinoides]